MWEGSSAVRKGRKDKVKKVLYFGQDSRHTVPRGGVEIFSILWLFFFFKYAQPRQNGKKKTVIMKTSSRLSLLQFNFYISLSELNNKNNVPNQPSQQPPLTTHAYNVNFPASIRYANPPIPPCAQVRMPAGPTRL